MKKERTNDLYYRHGRFAVPAGSRAALDFYLHRLLVPHSRREMLLAPLARKSSSVRQLLFANGKSAEKKGDSMFSTEFLTSLLVQRLKSAGVGMTGEAKLLLLGDYAHSARGQSVVFVFDEAAKAPFAVAKIGAPAHRDALEKEFRTLQDLSRRLPSKLAKSVPQPIDLFTESNRTVLLETALRGSSVHFEMRNSWRPRRLIERHFSLAFDWLADFHRATFTRKASFGELRTTELTALFQKLRQIGRTKQEEDFIAELTARAARFDDEEIPLSMLQGDFWTRNVLIDGAQTGVVDWEHARREGCALDDAFLFAVSYGRGYAWKLGQWLDPREAFARAFYGDSHLSAAINAQFENLCRRLGIDRKLLGVLFAAFLARRAVEEQESLSEKEVSVWQSLFRAYAALAAAKKNAFSG